MFSHRQRISVADDEVVEYSHIDQVQRLLEALGQLSIGLAGVGIA